MPDRRALPIALLAVATLTSSAALAQDRERRFEVVYTLVGRQFLTFGGHGDLWIGSGTIDTLASGGVEARRVGSFTDRAWSAGLTVGLAQVVSPSVIFEVRLGAGAILFEDDRLVSGDLDGRGEPHLGHKIEAEIIGRWFSTQGPTAGLGANLASLGLPDKSSTSMSLSPRLGWIWWGERFEDFVQVELGYQFPFVNGFIPDIEGAQRPPPVQTTWHGLNVALQWGF